MNPSDLVRVFRRMVEVSNCADKRKWVSGGYDPTSAESQKVFVFMEVGLPTKEDVDEGYTPDSQLLEVHIESIWGHRIKILDAMTNEIMTEGYWDNGWINGKVEKHRIEYVLQRIIFEGEFKSEIEAQRIKNQWLEMKALSEMPEDACPGCGCMPGEGGTEGCHHPDGCGYFE